MKTIDEYLDEVEHGDLMNLFLHHFSHAENPEPFLYKYQAQESPHSLEVTTNVDGRITKLQFSKDFPQEQLLQIEQKIKDTLLTPDTSIGADILFCHEQVKGYFRYKDLFQVIPVSEGAPMPNIGFRDYPFVMQFVYRKSSDMTIDYSRRREKAVIYTRFLNLLTNQEIRLNRNNAQSHWTFDIDEVTSKMTSSYRPGRIHL